MTTEQRELIAQSVARRLIPNMNQGVSVSKAALDAISEVLDPKPKRRGYVVAEKMLWAGSYRGSKHMFIHSTDETAGLISGLMAAQEGIDFDQNVDFCRKIIADVIESERALAAKDEREALKNSVLDAEQIIYRSPKMRDWQMFSALKYAILASISLRGQSCKTTDPPMAIDPSESQS
jgi:hypothetical protein